MFTDIKRTIKQTSVYSLGNISTKLVGFILLPLYTAHLLPEDYGILAILQAIMQILIGVFGLNLPTAMMRWYAPEKDPERQRSIVFTTLLTTLFVAVLLSVLLIPFSEQFAVEIFKNADFSTYFVFLFLAVSAGIINNIPLNLIRLKEKSVFYITLTTIKFTLIILSNIYFVAYLKIGVEGIIISELIGHLFVIIITTPMMIKNSTLKIDVAILWEMIKYGAPLVFSTVFTFVLTLGDRFIIKYFYGDSSVGIYSLGHKIASVINMLILQSFQLGFLPIAYKKLNDPNAKRYFSKVLTYYTLILVFAALTISLFSKELIEVLALNSEYWIAYIVVPIISFAFVLKGIQYNFALSFHYAKRTSYNAVIVIITAFANVVLNIILIQKYDFPGAAVSLFISVLIMMILSYFLGQKVYHVPYEIFKISKIIFVGLLLYFISLLFTGMGLWIELFAKAMLVVLFPILLYLMKIFEEIEIKRIKEILSKFIFVMHK
ncbi:MAG: oligosaccharide flippase family protein [Chlorobi bacterium]|nr:oligosaccharide flippase family protein [Chlorobiota bacterium]